MAEHTLAVRGLTKRFGALVVSDDIDLTLERNEIHAVIGPNGAGKTTLLAQIAGDVRSDRGTIAFNGHPIHHLSADARARLGIARSFQITTLVETFTALDNVALAIAARDALRMHVWRAARTDERLREPALSALDRVGIARLAEARVGDLAHGDKRLLELAVALATQPSLLLLDEPMAGMGHAESAAMIALLLALKGTVTMLLIEHDMEAVATLADRVSVLVSGRALISGTYAAVRADESVRRAYLGDEA